MKALILAGGRGSRIGGISNDRNKCMINIKGKPLLEYSLDIADKIDILEIVIVVGYKAEEIIDTYGNRYKDKQIRYVIQHEQKGLVHAIECARDAIAGDDFMLMLGDELLVGLNHIGMMDRYYKENLFGICGVVMIDDKELIKKTYAVITGDNDRIFRLIEKPLKPMNNIMGTGNCIFKNEIFSYIPQTPINQKRAEQELPDLIQCAIDDGRLVKSFVICNRYVNVNSATEIKEAESYFAHF